MSILNSIYELDLWYIPIITLVFFALAGILIGAWHGWKTATYFLIWHLVATLVAVFVGELLFTKFINDIIQKLNLDPNITESITNNKAMLINILIVVLIILAPLILDLVALFVYFFFRKKLKRKLKENAEIGVRNTKARFGGAAIGFVSVLPIAIASSSLTTILTPRSQIGKPFSLMTKYLTFGKVDDIYDDNRSILSIISGIDTLEALLSEWNDIDNFDPNNTKDLTDEEKANNKKKLEEILNLDGSSELLNDLAKKLIVEDITLDGNNQANAESIFLSKSDPLALNQKQNENLKDLLNQIFPDQTDKVDNFINNISA